MALSVGQTCLIVYDGYEEIAHQRILLKRVTPAMFAYVTGEASMGDQNLFWVMTPDGDVYPEEIAIPALRGFQLCQQDGVPIAGTRQGEMQTRRRYGFGGRGRQALTCENVLRACAAAVEEEMAMTVPELAVPAERARLGRSCRQATGRCCRGAGCVRGLSWQQPRQCRG
eukprot:6471406-Amphidinium_carterae.3